MVPAKNIVTLQHVEQFKTSQGCKELVGFINALSESIKNSKMTETTLTDVSESINQFTTTETQTCL